MFSGIVLGQGAVIKIQRNAKGRKIAVHHAGLGRGVRVGDSIAVDGCCLTVVSNRRQIFEFDILQETWNSTSFQFIKPQQKVNLEKSLRARDPMGGHFVTGHVDETARIAGYQHKGKDILLEVRPSCNLMQWIIMKGSITIDGVSLTVSRIGRLNFGVWLIPHTLKLTTLGWKREGDWVNLEGDMLAKYAQKKLEVVSKL